eukprot:CAMPEP_0206328226 /NCGR_PEP_ID=MMETSP0106_2-20121207/22566_1 /ASSEMBLY_ACC=CAM_ASM_000206 /TAXON_ID=81532 /ORGANISM="Acanthoeca-like sp., Strain 10tr" /LENGTH=62 /DNA_ID=CAMNT_0053760891 /DNA_START=38 /DNA_END=222 /DNA_ORIENTATION=+
MAGHRPVQEYSDLNSQARSSGTVAVSRQTVVWARVGTCTSTSPWEVCASSADGVSLMAPRGR